MEDADRKKVKKLALWAVGLFFAAIYLIAFLIGSSEFQGVQESFWSARTQYHFTIGIGFVCSILIALFLYVKLSFLTNKQAKHFLVIISSVTFLFLFWAATIYLNRVLDKEDPSIYDIKVTDAFVLNLQDRNGERHFEFFVAFNTPKEIRNYSLISLTGSKVYEFPLGKRYRVVRHSGFLGLPWSLMPTRLSKHRDVYINELKSFDKNEPYYSSGKQKYMILSAKGSFTPSSTISKLFEKYKISINGK